MEKRTGRDNDARDDSFSSIYRWGIGMNFKY